MIQVIAIALMISYAVTIFFVYRRIESISEKNIRYESEYLAETINANGTDFLKDLKTKLENGTRITLVDTDGSVLYDSTEDSKSLSNHSSRPEIARAMKNGRGADMRRSQMK